MYELVHPLVFERVYQFIFQLFGLSHVDQEAKYTNKLEVLNKKSDKALMSFYEVEHKFQPKFDSNDNQDSEVKNYTGAIEALTQIREELVPWRKLECLSTAFR